MAGSRIFSYTDFNQSFPLEIMCGIVGFVDSKGRCDEGTLEVMLKTLHHRGPDNQAFRLHRSNLGTIGLGHSRLSIIDISHSADQPMIYNEFSIVFNGEIYNYKEIRSVLEADGHVFRTNSDTEVILQAFKKWGVKCIEHFIGMFVFVIFDNLKQKLWLVRDRAGVKPLYYYKKEEHFFFASELKAFMNCPEFDKSLDEEALHVYFDLGYIPAPLSIFSFVKKLEGGCYLELDLNTKKVFINQYWNVFSLFQSPKLDISYDEAKQSLKNLLTSACNYRMIADVPVGVFLSGGYDSALVTAILQTDRTEKLKTFTIGFERGNNEAPYARQTANYLGTDHVEMICTEKIAQDIIPELSYYYDEPFADQSAIPTILVSRLAREKVTVALSADGGDELFAGYNRYFSFRNRIEQLEKIPVGLHSIAGWTTNALSSFLPFSKGEEDHRLRGISRYFNAQNGNKDLALYQSIHSLPHFLKQNAFKSSIHGRGFSLPQKSVFRNSIEMAMAVDFKYYLQDDILTKVDRATMSVSLEGREPLLDHRLVEFASQLPIEYKMTKNKGKRILRDIVHDFIPEELMNRPKTGFSVPIFSWLQGDLKFLVNDHLSMEQLEKSNIFNSKFVNKTVRDFQDKKFYYKPYIWRLLMFQMWYQRWFVDNKT